jgi:pimeloyl-ACP methyl ester carboxylesterase
MLMLGCFVTLAVGKNICLGEKTWDERGTRYTLVQSNVGTHNWLFVPGGPGADSSYFLPLIEKLYLPGKTWLVDLPDNGSNTQNHDRGIFDDWTDCLLGAVGRFENPIYVGHSFGGMLALSLPELEDVLKGLIIIGSCPVFDAQETASMVKEKNIVIPAGPGKIFRENPTIETFKAALLAGAPRHFPPHSLEIGRELLASLVFNLRVVLWGYSRIGSYQAKWVPQSLPTLIIGGSEDCINPISLFIKDQRFNRTNISLVVLQGSGHFPWIENCVGVKELFDQYVEEVIK